MREAQPLEEVPDADAILIHNPVLAKRVQQILRAVNYQWTIEEILRQPEPLTSDVFTIDRIRLGFEASKRIEDGDQLKALDNLGKLDGYNGR